MSNVSARARRGGARRRRIVCVQNAFNLLHRDDEETVQLCAERGIAYVPVFPLGSAFPGMPKVTESPAVRAVADRFGCDACPGGSGLVAAHAENILLIPGTSSVAHLEENIAAGSITLSEKDIAELETAG